MDFLALSGNWVDLIIILVLLFYLLEGWHRGLVIGFIDLLGFIASFVISLWWYPIFGEVLVANFALPRGIANAGGFLLCGFLMEMFFSLLIHVFYRKVYPRLIAQLHKDGMKTLFVRMDAFLGFVPAIGEALIFTAFILTILIALPVAGRVKKDIIASKIGGPLISRAQGIERQLNIIFGAAVNETLTFITVNPNPASDERVDLGFTQNEFTIDEAGEQTMFNLINSERVKVGLTPLLVSSELRSLARDYARDMFKRGYFSHYNPEGESPFDRMDRYDIGYLAAGENLALAPNVTLAHQGLMNSSGHRANILSKDFGKVGIGVIDGGIYGEMFVQEFTD